MNLPNDFFDAVFQIKNQNAGLVCIKKSGEITFPGSLYKLESELYPNSFHRFFKFFGLLQKLVNC